MCYRVLYTLYTYMSLLGCSFLLHSFNQFACIHKPIDISYFPLLYTQCLIACVCVWRGKERAFVVQCDFSGSKSFEKLPRNVRRYQIQRCGVGVAKLNINIRCYTVFVQSGLLELDQIVKIFFIFCQISWLIIVTLRLYINHNQSGSQKRHFFKLQTPN